MAPKKRPVKPGPPPHGYIALAGVTHDSSDTRIEAGKPVEGLPTKAIKALLEQNAIRPATKDEAAAWTEPDPDPIDNDSKDGDS